MGVDAMTTSRLGADEGDHERGDGQRHAAPRGDDASGSDDGLTVANAIGITCGWSVDSQFGAAYTARRLAIARVMIAGGAKIIVMDEPTQGTRQRTTPPETRSRAEEPMSAPS